MVQQNNVPVVESAPVRMPVREGGADFIGDFRYRFSKQYVSVK